MKKYIPFFKAGMMEEMSYKAAIFSWLGISVLQLACIVFLWISVFANSTSDVINGFTFPQMIVYFVMANIFAFTSLETSTLQTIDDEIKDGTIAISFIKPISYRLRFLATALGGCLLRWIILGVPCMIVAFVVFINMGYMTIESPGRFILSIILFILCGIFAMLISDTINYICGICCFYTTAAWGLNQTKTVVVNFFSGVFIPLSFFPGVFGDIASLLPFAGLTQNPVLILMQTATINEAVMYVVKNIIWFIIFEIIAKLLFIHASKKVTVQGG